MHSHQFHRQRWRTRRLFSNILMIMRLPHPPLRKHQTLEMDRDGAIIIDPGHELHLGQKPKLGGGTPTITLIYISYSVGSLYIHVSLSSFLSFDVLVLFLLSKTQKDQKYFRCFSLVISLVLCVWFAQPSSQFAI